MIANGKIIIPAIITNIFKNIPSNKQQDVYIINLQFLFLLSLFLILRLIILSVNITGNKNNIAKGKAIINTINIKILHKIIFHNFQFSALFLPYYKPGHPKGFNGE